MKPYGSLRSLTSTANQRTLPDAASTLRPWKISFPNVNKIIVSPEAESVVISWRRQDGALVPVPVGPNPSQPF